MEIYHHALDLLEDFIIIHVWFELYFSYKKFPPSLYHQTNPFFVCRELQVQQSLQFPMQVARTMQIKSKLVLGNKDSVSFSPANASNQRQIIAKWSLNAYVCIYVSSHAFSLNITVTCHCFCCMPFIRFLQSLCALPIPLVYHPRVLAHLFLPFTFWEMAETASEASYLYNCYETVLRQGTR